MKTSVSLLDHFLRRVHRRLVALRTLESMGWGTAASCFITIILIPILLYRHAAALTPSLIILAAGAAVGGLWSLFHVPSRLQAAMEADRQLSLADLLGTACELTAVQQREDPWAQTILRLAQSRCANLSPNDVLLNRWGVRAWSAVGLGICLILTLGLFSNATEVRAQSRAPVVPLNSPLRASMLQLDAAQSIASLGPSHDRRVPSQQNSADDNNTSIAVPIDTAENGDGAAGASSPRASSPASGGATGDGSSRTDRPPTAPHTPLTPHRNPSSTSEVPASASVQPSPGISPSVQSGGPAHKGAFTGAAGAPQAASQVPASDSAQWQSARSAADAALRNGAVPDAYRDLVRGYFSPAQAESQRDMRNPAPRPTPAP